MRLNHFPENPSGNFGETEGLLGVKLGARSDRIGLAVDLGAALECYSRSRRWGWRFDGGDTVIPFGADTILLGGIPPTRQPGMTHNFQLLAGLVFEFQ